MPKEMKPCLMLTWPDDSTSCSLSIRHSQGWPLPFPKLPSLWPPKCQPASLSLSARLLFLTPTLPHLLVSPCPSLLSCSSASTSSCSAPFLFLGSAQLHFTSVHFSPMPSCCLQPPYPPVCPPAFLPLCSPPLCVFFHAILNFIFHLFS